MSLEMPNQRRDENTVPRGNGLQAALTDLHETYISQVNQAVAADREDLAEELAAVYTDDALSMITAPEGVQPASA